jgi:hypothetical protein
MPLNKIFNLTNVTLVTALSLSTVAAYYSIVGLTAIFAGAVIPIIVMGSILEVGKIVTTVWLRKYWHLASWVLKLYLVPAVVVLALLTSMGIFGFLSKAHMDSGLVSGDVQAKLSLIDEKIKTQRENVDLARKALTQMDAQVDARLTRGDSENSAERAVTIRRQQAGERAKLQKDIADAQVIISQLNEERAPIAAENRKVEAEVGPIKYIAALIYGDNPDNNLLERAVRWVIIILVLVFDPLAIALVLAGNSSKEWDKKLLIEENTSKPEPEPEPELPKDYPAINETIEPQDVVINEATHPYLYKTGGGFKNLQPMVYKEEPVTKPVEEVVETPIEETTEPVTVVADEVNATPTDEISTENVTKERPYAINTNGYITYDGKQMRLEALRELKPELFLTADSDAQLGSRFGSQFPKEASKGDVFVRIDSLPNRAFKFDGKRWVEISRDSTEVFQEDNQYIQFLISKIDSGEYNIELLSDSEKERIAKFLESHK